MKAVILESPYAGATPVDIELNLMYGRLAMRDCLVNFDEAPLGSHLLYTQPGVLDDSIPEQRALGVGAGLEWGKVAWSVVFYVDYGMSPGMVAALEHHRAADRVMTYRRLSKALLAEYDTRAKDYLARVGGIDTRAPRSTKPVHWTDRV